MGFIENLPKVEYDKTLHIIYGSAIFTVCYISISLLLLLVSEFVFVIPMLGLLLLSIVASLVLTAILAYAKEKYSANTGRGTDDMADFRFTLLGAVPNAVVALFTVWMLHL